MSARKPRSEWTEEQRERERVMRRKCRNFRYRHDPVYRESVLAPKRKGK